MEGQVVKMIRDGAPNSGKTAREATIAKIEKAFPHAKYGSIVEDDDGNLWKCNTVMIGDYTYGD